MTTKVLIADDSQTIHKVVKITLANTAYELIQASSESELFQKITNDVDLVLLDFTLSDSMSGYDLATKVKESSPKSSILAMLGTFDSIEDGKMIQSGIDDKITKPFESDKFIAKCEELISAESTQSTSFVSVSEEESDDFADGWVVDSPEVEDVSEAQSESLEMDNENALHDEMKGWGVEVPGVISTNSEQSSFPPVIEGQENIVQEEVELSEEPVLEAEEEESIIPDDTDLEYPDDMGVDYVGSSEEELKAVTYPGSTEEEEVKAAVDEDATDPNFQMPEEFTAAESSEVVDLEAEVEAENEVSADEFWAADDEEEEVELQLEASPVVVQEVEEETPVEAETQSEQVEQKEEPVANVQFDEDKIVERVTNALAPILENMVKEMCNTKVEEVAWEVIPDLAENLIRKEIKDISSSVMSDQ